MPKVMGHAARSLPLFQFQPSPGAIVDASGQKLF
jgi:hypothetical protein